MPPPEANELHEEPSLLLGLLCVGAGQATLGVRAVQDQTTHTFGVPRA